DFRLGIGTAFDKAATVVHVDTDLADLGRHAARVRACLGDPAAFLEDLARAVAGIEVEPAWIDTLVRARAEQAEATKAALADATDAHHPAAVAEVLGQVADRHG